MFSNNMEYISKSMAVFFIFTIICLIMFCKYQIMFYETYDSTFNYELSFMLHFRIL